MKNLIFCFIIVIIMIQVSYATPDSSIVWMKYTQDISRLQFSKDDSKILTIGVYGSIIIFDTQTGNVIKQLPGYNDAEYSEDNSLIVATHQQSDSLNNVFPYVDIIDGNSYEVIKSIKLNMLPTSVITESIRISRDNSLISLINVNGLYFIDVQTGKILKFTYEFGGGKGSKTLNDHVFTKDGNELILSHSIDIGQGQYKGELLYINTKTYQIDYKCDSIGGKLQISKDGKMLACGTSSIGKAVAIMNTDNHQIIGSILGNTKWVTTLRFSSDNNYLAVGGLIGGYGLKIFQLFDFSFYRTVYSKASWSCVDIKKDNSQLVQSIGNQLYLISLGTTGVIDNKTIIETLYPNPSNGILILSFTLLTPSIINYNLYDISGKLISKLKNQFYDAGQVIENLNISTYNNGTYFLKIESDNYNKTFKVIIN